MTFRSITKDEIPLLTDIMRRAFRSDASHTAERLTEESHRFSFADGRLWIDELRGPVAGLFLFERNVTLNGGELPAGLLASVAVPPDQRRRGYANQILCASLQEMHQRRLPISLLFPYSIPFYNRLGYGIASDVWMLEFPLKEMVDFDEVALVRRAGEEDHPAMKALYERERWNQNGWFHRTEWEWSERVLDLPGYSTWPKRVEAVVVPGEGDMIHGYLTYTLAPLQAGSDERVLSIHEWVSENDLAWRALAGFVANQRAYAGFVRYAAPRGFPLYHALRERNTYRDRREKLFTLRDTFSQGTGVMIRLIDAERAFRERGYAPGASGSFLIQLRDPQLPANEIPLHLSLAGGKATVTPLGPGSASSEPTAVADVRTWSELYAGSLHPRDARLLGRLQADDETVAFLAAAFEGKPWYMHQADWF